ncbi:MAG TPA: hypothetical protein VGO93_23265 [Candidatus Xenobia bacterium]|jgi:hypothetical protein
MDKTPHADAQHPEDESTELEEGEEGAEYSAEEYEEEEGPPPEPAAVCPACHTANPEKKWLCPSCGALTASLEVEKVAEVDINPETPEGYFQVDVVSNEGLPGEKKFHKSFPMEEGRNWKRLHECAAGALDGSMTDEVYKAKLDETIQIADTGVKLFQADVVKARLKPASEQNQALAQATAECAAHLLSACQEMLKWLTTRHAANVQRGLDMAVQAFKTLDQVREIAFDAANDEWDVHEAAQQGAAPPTPQIG